MASQAHRKLLFQIVLRHLSWRYAEIAASESFLALQKGPQGARWSLGGVPKVMRTDNRSVATRPPQADDAALVASSMRGRHALDLRLP